MSRPGFAQGVSHFCNFLKEESFVFSEDTMQSRASSFFYNYNNHVYDPIYFSVEWKRAEDCPTLDFTAKGSGAMDICKERLSVIKNGCE